MQISNNSGEIYFSVIVKKYVKYDWSKWMKEYTVSKYLVRKSINDDYDVDQLADRIKTLIVDDANYRNVTAIENFR